MVSITLIFFLSTFLTTISTQTIKSPPDLPNQLPILQKFRENFIKWINKNTSPQPFDRTLEDLLNNQISRMSTLKSRASASSILPEVKNQIVDTLTTLTSIANILLSNQNGTSVVGSLIAGHIETTITAMQLKFENALKSSQSIAPLSLVENENFVHPVSFSIENSNGLSECVCGESSTVGYNKSLSELSATESAQDLTESSTPKEVESSSELNSLVNGQNLSESSTLNSVGNLIEFSTLDKTESSIDSTTSEHTESLIDSSSSTQTTTENLYSSTSSKSPENFSTSSSISIASSTNLPTSTTIPVFCNFASKIFDSNLTYIKSVCFVDSSLNYVYADEFCEVNDMHLYGISTLDEMNGIFGFISENFEAERGNLSFWVNGVLLNHEWLIQSPYPVLVYSSAIPMTRSPSELCLVVLRSDGNFLTKSEKCANEMKFLCEFYQNDT